MDFNDASPRSRLPQGSTRLARCKCAPALEDELRRASFGSSGVQSGDPLAASKA